MVCPAASPSRITRTLAALPLAGVLLTHLPATSEAQRPGSLEQASSPIELLQAAYRSGGGPGVTAWYEQARTTAGGSMGLPLDGLVSFGTQVLREGRGDDAALLMEITTREHPQAPPAWLQLGTAFLYAGRAEEARGAFERAASLAPGDPGLRWYYLDQFAARRQDAEEETRAAPAFPPGAPTGLNGPYLGQDPPGTTPLVFAPGIISVVGRTEVHLSFSPDGRELFLTTLDGPLHSHREQGGWTAPSPVSEGVLAGLSEVNFSPDGARLWGNRERAVWSLERSAEAWGEPVLRFPGGMFASEASDATVYFTLVAPEGGHVVRSTFRNGSYQDPERVEEGVFSPAGTAHPLISPDGSFLLFDSPRPGGQGGFDLWIARRQGDGGFGEAANLGPAVNSLGQNMCAYLSPDGKYLFFTRFGDIWWVSSEILGSFREPPLPEADPEPESVSAPAEVLDRGDPAQVTIPFRLDHNRMLVEAEARGGDGSWRSVHLWVDSGNPDLWLSPSLARELGIDLAGADTATVEGRLAVPPPTGLRVGDMALDLEGVPAYVVFEPTFFFTTTHMDANLPSTILRHYQVVFDYPAGEVTLAEPGTLQPRGDPVPASVSPETGIPQMDVVIDGDSISLAVDIGASYGFVNESVLDRLLQRHPEWPRMQGAVGHANIWGWLNGEATWTVARIPELRTGPVGLAEVGLVGQPEFAPGYDLGYWYSQRTARPVAGFLGPNAFQGFRMEIDYPAGTIHLERTRETDPFDMDLVGITLAQEPDGGYRVMGASTVEGASAVPEIHPGDKLLRVDDLETTGATMGTVVDALRGRPGDRRILVLARGGTQLTVEATVRRLLPRAGEGG